MPGQQDHFVSLSDKQLYHFCRNIIYYDEFPIFNVCFFFIKYFFFYISSGWHPAFIQLQSKQPVLCRNSWARRVRLYTLPTELLTINLWLLSSNWIMDYILYRATAVAELFAQIGFSLICLSHWYEQSKCVKSFCQELNKLCQARPCDQRDRIFRN